MIYCTEQFPREVIRAGSKYRHEILHNQEKMSILTKDLLAALGKGVTGERNLVCPVIWAKTPSEARGRIRQSLLEGVTWSEGKRVKVRGSRRSSGRDLVLEMPTWGQPRRGTSSPKHPMLTDPTVAQGGSALSIGGTEAQPLAVGVKGAGLLKGIAGSFQGLSSSLDLSLVVTAVSF